MEQQKILWVEDDAVTSLTNLLPPVYFHGGYLVEVASNATDAVNKLMHRIYDGVVFDIRFPPGSHPLWINLYKRTARGTVETHLGLSLLYWALGKKPCVPLREPHLSALDTLAQQVEELRQVFPLRDPLSPDKVAIFSIERRLQVTKNGHLDCLGLTTEQYHQKRITMPDDFLLQILKKHFPYRYQREKYEIDADSS